MTGDYTLKKAPLPNRPRRINSTSNKEKQMLTVSMFNEAHQKAFGRAPCFEAPERSGPDHCPVVSVILEIEGMPDIVGQGRNQRVARQDAVNQVLAKLDQLPGRLRRAIEDKIVGL